MKYSEIYGVKKKEASTGEKIKDTTLDVLANLGTGISRSLEGIVDYGMGIVGGIGGIWDKDFQEKVRKNIVLLNFALGYEVKNIEIQFRTLFLYKLFYDSACRGALIQHTKQRYQTRRGKV